MKRLVLVVLVVLVVAPARSSRADETATIVLAAPSSDGATYLNLPNRELPAGVSIRIQIPAPGSEPTSGSLLVWPALADRQCKGTPGQGALQRHEIGLAANGYGDNRVLEATIPPLQLATRYCLRVTFDRRLSAEILNAVAEVVAATPIAWITTCQRGDREAYLAGEFAKRLEKQLESYGPKVMLSHDRVVQATTTIAKLFDSDAHCVRIGQAIAHRDELTEQQRKAAARLEVTKHELLCIPKGAKAAKGASKEACTKPATSLFAWPGAVNKVGSEVQVMTLADAIESSGLSALAAALAEASPAAATELRTLVSLTAADQKAAAKARLTTRPAAAQPLAVYLPTLNHYVDLTQLYDTNDRGEPTDIAKQVFADLLKNLPVNAAVVIGQLQLMRKDDPKAADLWIRLLTRLGDANQDEIVTEQLVGEGEKAVEAVAASFGTELRQVVQADTVKDLLRLTASEPIAQSSSKAPATDEKGSWISPNAGVLAALPIIESRGHRGIPTGWVEPYAGASLYRTRVDRVIDLDDLVGNTFWQRNSLTVGFLFSRPSLNGKDIRGPWSVGAVPVIGFGHRVTQYFRLDAGVIPFTYADVNPVIVDSHVGVAFWIGASLDADVWAAVSGKLGR